MPYDPALPADHSPLSSAEMRSQLAGLQSNLTAAAADKATHAEVGAAISTAISGTAVNPSSVAPLNIYFSNPPTDSQLFDVQAKINELIAALYRAP